MRFVKALAVILLLLNHLLITLIARYLIRDGKKRRRYFLQKDTNYSRRFFRILNVQLIVENRELLKENETYLWVANHLSYFDAMILASLRPVCFVTSIEMRETPVLGLFTELGGCLYTERRSKENLRNEIASLSQALQDGFDIAIFPEGTSSNGSSVLPFKRGLLASAVDAKKSVLPMVIQYEEIEGKKVNPTNRDLLCWYGDMGFGSHFLKLTTLKSVKIRLKILPEISVTSESTKDTLVASAYKVIAENYVPIT